MKYHIWTEGCQMNVADSLRIGSALERLGYENTPSAEKADVIVLNTCVVRKSAEDRAYGRLHSLRPLKEKNPKLVINLMGCLVGVRGDENLQKRLPFVDVFSPPSDPRPLIAHLTQEEAHHATIEAVKQRYSLLDEDYSLPLDKRGSLVASFVPAVYGCSHACTYCIIPYRRGIETSRPAEDIIEEVNTLVGQGVKEVTLLGQIIDRYGIDNPDGPNLAGLLRQLNQVEGLLRIRFLTSHPNWMTDELLDAVVTLPKVMPHIEVPIQAGDDDILTAMKRGYTNSDYRRLIERIRSKIPTVSIATDIIVGFPGENKAQFMNTYKLLADLKMDVAHLARYSPRPGTVAYRRMTDDVPAEEKMRRFRLLEELQERIAAEINAQYLYQNVDVLFEERIKGRWRGRTPTNKLVFVENERNLRGQILPVRITWSGPWSMQADLTE